MRPKACPNEDRLLVLKLLRMNDRSVFVIFHYSLCSFHAMRSTSSAFVMYNVGVFPQMLI
jgi:hypothetical protein